jgi:tRNA dimethylallyltransferase
MIPAVLLMGPTAAGKSAVAMALARHVGGEIVSADSAQVYRGMDIGTAKLPIGERRGIPHHLLDALDVTDEAAVAWYQAAARTAIAQVHARGADAILVGGSGLYVSSVLFDFRFPPHDDELRAELEAELAEHGPGMLFARLRAADPATAERIDPKNGRRIVRALEVLAQGAQTHGAALPDAPVLWHDQTVVFGVAVPRAELVERLDARVARMWADGLLDEVTALRTAGLEEGVTARRAIGYAQALAQLTGAMTELEAITQTQALTRRYARRQVSWFTRYEALRWVESGADAAALADSVGSSEPLGL